MNSEDHFKLGVASADIDNLESAITYLEKAGSDHAGALEMLAHIYFRLEKHDLAKEYARRALAHDIPSPRKEWLLLLVDCDTLGFFPEPVSAHWQNWVTKQLQGGTPRPRVIRLLEEENFIPGQILTALRTYDEKFV